MYFAVKLISSCEKSKITDARQNYAIESRGIKDQFIPASRHCFTPEESCGFSQDFRRYYPRLGIEV